MIIFVMPTGAAGHETGTFPGQSVQFHQSKFNRFFSGKCIQYDS